MQARRRSRADREAGRGAGGVRERKAEEDGEEGVNGRAREGPP